MDWAYPASALEGSEGGVLHWQCADICVYIYIYIYTHIHTYIMYIYICILYIYIYILMLILILTLILPVSVKKSFLFCQPLPCNPAAETALKPLIRSFET